MPRVWFSLVVTIALLAHSVPSSRAQGDPAAALASLKALGLEWVSNESIAFFRAPDRERALSLQRELNRGLAFFKRSRSLERQIRLAVLQPPDWARLTDLPFGFPNNFGAPANLILAPASRPRSDPNLPDSLADLLLLFHEGGHLLTFELVGPETDPAYSASLDKVPEWYWEFAANAFLTSYLRAEHQADAAAMQRYFEALAAVPRPQFTALDDWFARMMGHTADGQPYMRTDAGRQNFGWYQGVVGLLGTHFRAEAEPALFGHIRTIGRRERPPTTIEIMKELDALAPGLIARADALGAGWR